MPVLSAAVCKLPRRLAYSLSFSVSAGSFVASERSRLFDARRYAFLLPLCARLFSLDALDILGRSIFRCR